jgi:hypothetical protein
VSCVKRIIDLLKRDPDAEIRQLRNEIDEAIFDLFEVGPASRDEVRRFYNSVGRAERPDQAASE